MPAYIIPEQPIVEGNDINIYPPSLPSTPDYSALKSMGEAFTKPSSNGVATYYNPSLDNRYQDPNLGFNPNRNNENLYEQNQSKGEYWSNILSGTWAITKEQFKNVFANTFNLGVGNEQLNSEVTKELSETMQSINDKYPIYQSSQDTWWKNSSNFVGETLPQLGFTLGTAAAILTQEAALALITAPLGGEGAFLGLAEVPLAIRSAKTSLDVYKALQQASQLMKLSKVLNLGSATSKLYGVAKFALINHVSSVSEAAVEGYDAKINAKQLLESSQYDNLTFEQKDALANEIGLKTLKDNYKLLLMTNIIPIAQWVPGVKNLVGDITGRLLGRGIALGAEGATETLVRASKTMGQKILRKSSSLLTPLTEGLEEYNQGVIREGVTKYYLDKLDPNKKNNVKTLSQYYTDEFVDRVNNPQAQKEFLSGVFIGGISSVGAGVFNASKNKLSDHVGFISPTGDKALQKQLDTFNTAISASTGNLESFLNHIFNSTLDKSNAIQAGDIKTSKDIEDAQKIEFYKLLVKNGSADLLIEALQSAKTMDKSEFLKRFGIDEANLNTDIIEKFNPAEYIDKIVSSIKNYKSINSNVVSFLNKNPNITTINSKNLDSVLKNVEEGKKQLFNFLPFTKSKDPVLAKLAQNQEDAVFLLSDILASSVQKKQRFSDLERDIEAKVPFLSSITTNEFFSDQARELAINSYEAEIKSIIDLKLKSVGENIFTDINNARLNELIDKVKLLKKLHTFEQQFSKQPIINSNKEVIASSIIKIGDIINNLNNKVKGTKVGVKEILETTDPLTESKYLGDNLSKAAASRYVNQLQNWFQEYLNMEAKYSNKEKVSVDNIQDVWNSIQDALSVYNENIALLDTYNKLLNPSSFANLADIMGNVQDEIVNAQAADQNFQQQNQADLSSISGILNSTLTDDEKKVELEKFKAVVDQMISRIAGKVFNREAFTEDEQKIFALYPKESGDAIDAIRKADEEAKRLEAERLALKEKEEKIYNRINAAQSKDELLIIKSDIVNLLAQKAISQDKYDEFNNIIDAKIKALAPKPEDTEEDYIPDPYEFIGTPVQFNFDSSTNQVEEINNSFAFRIQKFFNLLIDKFSKPIPFQNKAALKKVIINGVERVLVGKLILDEVRFYKNQDEFDKAIAENAKVQTTVSQSKPGFSKNKSYNYPAGITPGTGLRLVMGYEDEKGNFIEVSYNQKHDKLGVVGTSATLQGQTVNTEDEFTPFGLFTHTNRLNNPSYEKYWIEEYSDMLLSRFLKDNKGSDLNEKLIEGFYSAAKLAFATKKEAHFKLLQSVLDGTSTGLVDLPIIGLGYGIHEYANTGEFLEKIKGSNYSVVKDIITVPETNFENSDQRAGKPYLTLLRDTGDDIITEFLPIRPKAIVTDNSKENKIKFQNEESNPLEVLFNLLTSGAEVEHEKIVRNWYQGLFRPYIYSKEGLKVSIDLAVENNKFILVVGNTKFTPKNIEELREVYLGFSRTEHLPISTIYYNIKTKFLKGNISNVVVVGNQILIGETISYLDFIVNNTSVSDDLLEVTDEDNPSATKQFERTNINSYLLFQPKTQTKVELEATNNGATSFKPGVSTVNLAIIHMMESLGLGILDRIKFQRQLNSLSVNNNNQDTEIEILTQADFNTLLGKTSSAPGVFLNGKIYLNFDNLNELLKAKSTRPIEVILEEYVHLQTADWIKNNLDSDLVKQLQALHQFTRDNASEIIKLSNNDPQVIQIFDAYINNTSIGINSLLEFVANVTSHQGLMEATSKMVINDKSLLQSIVDLIKSILEILKVDPTLQANVLAITQGIIKQNADFVSKQADSTENKTEVKSEEVKPSDPVIKPDLDFSSGLEALNFYSVISNEINIKNNSTKLKIINSIDADIALILKKVNAGSKTNYTIFDLIEGKINENNLMDKLLKTYQADLFDKYEKHITKNNLENTNENYNNFIRNSTNRSDVIYLNYVINNFNDVISIWRKESTVFKVKGDIVFDINSEDYIIDSSEDRTENDVEDNRDKSGEYDRKTNEVSNIDPAVKALVKSLLRIKGGRLGETLETNNYGRPKLVDAAIIWSKILNAANGALNYQDMISKLEKAALSDYSLNQLVIIVKELVDTKNNIPFTVNNNTIKESFSKQLYATKIFQAFSGRVKVDSFLMLTTTDDNGNTLYKRTIETDSIFKRILTKFSDNFIKLSKDPNINNIYYVKKENENVSIDVIKLFKNHPVFKNTDYKLSDIKDFFKALGFNFADETFKEIFKNNNKDVIDFINYFKVDYEKSFNKATSKNNANQLEELRLTNPVSQIYEGIKYEKKQLLESQAGRLNIFLAVESKYTNEVPSISVLNINGDKIYTMGVKNSVLEMLSIMNHPSITSLEQLKQITGFEFLDSGYAKNSLILKNLFTKTGKNDKFSISFGLLGGVKNETEETAKQANSLTEVEWLKYNINNLLKYGNYEIMRAESASSMFTFNIRNTTNPNDIPHLLVQPTELDDDFSIMYINRYIDYLKDEFERLKGKDKGTIIKYFKQGLFNFLTNSYKENELEDLINNELTKEQIVRLRFVIKNKLNESFRTFKDVLVENRIFNDSLIDKTIAETLGMSELTTEQGLRIFFGNYMISNIEQTKIFDGPLEYFANFHKRAKGMVSTGNTPIVDLWLIDSLQQDAINTFGYEFNEEYKPWDTKTKSSTLNEVNLRQPISLTIDTLIEGYMIAYKLDANNPEHIKRAQEKLAPYTKMKIADGQGYCTLDFYRSFRISVGNWDYKKDELGFKYLLAKHRIENGSKAYVDNPELINTDKKLIAYIQEHKLSFSFPPIKMQGRGYRSDSKPFFDKFSIAPLIPEAIKNSYMEVLNKKMLQSNIGYIKLKSGTKLDFVENEKVLNETEFNQLMKDGYLVEEGLDFNNKYHEIPNIYLKEQILTSNKIKTKNIFGTQFRKLILASQFKNGKIVIPSLKPQYDKFIGAITDLSNLELDSLLKELGIENNSKVLTITNYQDFVERIDIISKKTLEETEYYARIGDEDSKQLAIEYKQLSDKLLAEATRRAMNNNVLDAMSLKEGKFAIPLELNTNKQSISNLIRGMVNNKLIRQETNGTQLIQVSALGFSKFSNPTDEDIIKYQTTDQRFYVPIIKDGKIIEVTKAQIKIGLIGQYKNLLNLNITAIKGTLDVDRDTISDRDLLNRIIRTVNQLRYNQYSNLQLTELELQNRDLLLDWYKNNLETSLTLAGYRIPTQGYNSMEALEIEEFLPEEVGNIIVPPAEIVAKSGSDFDIDKMSVIAANIDFNGKYISQANLRSRLNSITDYAERILAKIELKEDLESRGWEANVKGDNSKSVYIQSEDFIRDILNSNAELNYTEEEINDILIELSIIKINSKTEEKQRDELKTKIRGVIDEFESYKFKKQSLQNNIIEATSEILLHPDNFGNLITPNSTDLVDDAINTLLDKLGLASAVGLHNSNIKPTLPKENTKYKKSVIGLKEGFVGWENILPQTNLSQYKVMFGLKELLGIAAVNNTFATIFHQNGFKINSSYTDKDLLSEIVNHLSDNNLNPINGKIDFSNSKNELGEDIVEIISQMINIFVDSASDPRIGYLNIHKRNTGALMYMLMRGYSFEKVMALFNLPVVYNFEKQDYTRFPNTNPVSNNKYMSKSYHNFDYIWQKLVNTDSQEALNLRYEIIKHLEKKMVYVKGKGMRPMATFKKDKNTGTYQLATMRNPFYAVNYIANLLNKQERQFTREELINKLVTYDKVSDYAPANNNNESLDDLILLSHYIKTLQEADMLRMVETRLNFDTSRHQSVLSSLSQVLLENDIYQSRFVDKEYVDRILNESPVKSFAINDKFVRIHQILMPIQFSGNFIAATINAIKIFKSKKEKDFIFNVTNEEVESFTRIYTNDFIEAIIKTYGQVNGKNFNEHGKELLTNDKFINLITNLKSNPESAELFEQFSVLNRFELVKPSDKKGFKKLNNWTIVRAGEDTVENQNEYIKELEDLYQLGKFYVESSTSTEAEKKVGRDLAALVLNMTYLAFYQSGFNKSPISFTDIVPNSLLYNLVEPALAQYESLAEEDQLKFLSDYTYEFFIQNPRFNEKEKYTVKDTMRGKDYNLKAKKYATKFLELLKGIKLNVFKEDNFNEDAAFVNEQDQAELDEDYNSINDEENLESSDNSSNIATMNIDFQEEPTTGYRNRTIKNASADATIAIAVDFNSAGEKLTKTSVLAQNKKYISLNANNLTVTQDRVDKVVEALNSVNAKTLNIAGNGIYTMKGKYTQKQVDDFTYELLKQVINSPKLKNAIISVRSGGQTGFDEAGAKAGIKLGISTIVLAPKGWTFRNLEGKDISNEKQFKDRFNTSGLEALDFSDMMPNTTNLTTKNFKC